MITCDICKKIHSKCYKIKIQTDFKIYTKQLPSEEKFGVKNSLLKAISLDKWKFELPDCHFQGMSI